MKLKNTPQLQLRVINGGKHHLENALMKQIAEGLRYEEALERLKPKGDLRLVHSSPNLSEQEEADWLNFEDLNL